MKDDKDQPTPDSSAHELDFPPDEKLFTTVICFFYSIPLGGLFAAVFARYAFDVDFFRQPRESLWSLILIAVVLAAVVSVVVRWIQRLRDPAPVRVTLEPGTIVEWSQGRRRVVLPLTEARRHLVRIKVVRSGSSTAPIARGRVLQLSDGKGKVITVSDGDKSLPGVDWLANRRCHTASIDALDMATRDLPTTDKLERDDRARARYDSGIYMFLSLLGYGVTAASLGVLAQAASQGSETRDAMKGLLVGLGLLVLRSIRPLTEVLSRRADRGGRRAAGVELVLRLAMVAVIGVVSFQFVDQQRRLHDPYGGVRPLRPRR